MKSLLLSPLLALAAAGCASAPADPPPPPASENRTLTHFSCKSGPTGWHVENDDVMGGRSQSSLVIDENGNAVFSGAVSFENGGGFASIQCDFDALDVSAERVLHLGLKGDGHRYQARLDAAKNARLSYAADFQTSGNWQEIVLPFADFYAIRHGDRLDLPPYPGQTLARLQILAVPEAPGPFRLEIDRIWLTP